MTHANAPLTPVGRRRLAELIVVHGWSVRRAAERFQCLAGDSGEVGCALRAGLPMTDRSSRPHIVPDAVPAAGRAADRRAAVLRRWGPHRISYHLGVPRSTVGRVLARYRMPLLAHVDQATGLPVRKPKPVRYEAAAPGDLVHVDIKKLGRIPDGGGWRAFGRGSAQDRRAQERDRAGRSAARQPRAATSSCTTPSTTTPGSPTPRSSPTNARRPPPRSGTGANAFFAEAGITVRAVMTDNGSCYRSKHFAARARRQHQTPTHPALPAPDQRQSRTLQPHPGRRMGLRQDLPLRRRPRSDLRTTGSTPTITTDPTPASEASSPPTAFTTSRGTTASGRR